MVSYLSDFLAIFTLSKDGILPEASSRDKKWGGPKVRNEELSDLEYSANSKSDAKMRWSNNAHASVNCEWTIEPATYSRDMLCTQYSTALAALWCGHANHCQGY